MEELEDYLKMNISYKDFYIDNNVSLKNIEYTMEQFYIEVSFDIDVVFSTLNILPNKSGYLFWKDAVFLYIFLGKNKVSICNDIYPHIAKKHNTTTMCVDRAMRRCFENVLYYVSKKDENYICSYLKNTLLYPHNSELIVKIVELISSKRFQQDKIK